MRSCLARDMMRFTLCIHILGAVSLAAAVALLPSDRGLVAVALSYVAGLMTVLGSQYAVNIEPSTGPDGEGERTRDVGRGGREM